MTQKKQTWLPAVTYHCESRCLEDRNLLSEKWVREMAGRVMDRAREKYNFELVDMKCAGSRFHLTIRTVEGAENMTPVIRYVKAQIAEGYNKETKRIGPFWNGRSKYRILGDCENPAVTFINQACTVSDSSVNSGLYGMNNLMPSPRPFGPPLSH